jgi:hypothetical protein
MVLRLTRLSWREIADIDMHLAISAIVVAITDHYRMLVRQLWEEEHYRGLLVNELRPWLTNKSATLEATIRRGLRADSASQRGRPLGADIGVSFEPATVPM